MKIDEIPAPISQDEKKQVPIIPDSIHEVDLDDPEI